MHIHYFSEDIDYILQNQQEISNWITQVANSNKKSITNISYVFCSDEYLLNVNQEHLNHDYYTDIITFDNSEAEDSLESDIFISIDRVKENASNENISFERELCRVMIHGILHLIGFDDKSDSDKVLMREKEDACLSLLKF